MNPYSREGWLLLQINVMAASGIVSLSLSLSLSLTGALVVFEEDVERRLVLIDERRLQKKSFRTGHGGDILDPAKRREGRRVTQDNHEQFRANKLPLQTPTYERVTRFVWTTSLQGPGSKQTTACPALQVCFECC